MKLIHSEPSLSPLFDEQAGRSLYMYQYLSILPRPAPQTSAPLAAVDQTLARYQKSECLDSAPPMIHPSSPFTAIRMRWCRSSRRGSSMRRKQ